MLSLTILLMRKIKILIFPPFRESRFCVFLQGFIAGKISRHRLKSLRLLLKRVLSIPKTDVSNQIFISKILL